MEDFLSGASVIPLRGNAPSQPQPRNDGLLSALSSYLMTPYSTSEQVPEATDSDVESTLCTIDCITSCRLDELYSQIMWVLVLKIYEETDEPQASGPGSAGLLCTSVGGSGSRAYSREAET